MFVDDKENNVCGGKKEILSENSENLRVTHSLTLKSEGFVNQMVGWLCEFC